jgi:hypothetical protein
MLNPGSSPTTIPGQTVEAEFDGTATLHLQDWQGRRKLYPSARTNRLTYSTDMTSASGWTGGSGGTGTPATCTAVAGAAPDGGTAFRIQANRGAGNTTSDSSRWTHNNLASITGVRTVSIWLKSNTGSPQLITLEPSSGTVATIRVDSTWRKFAVPFSYSGTTLQPLLIGTRGAFGADASVDILAACPQWEDGPVATAWIPTGAAAVTVTDYTMTSAGAITMAAAPVSAARLTWWGAWKRRARGFIANVTRFPRQKLVGPYLASDVEVQFTGREPLATPNLPEVF